MVARLGKRPLSCAVPKWSAKRKSTTTGIILQNLGIVTLLQEHPWLYYELSSLRLSECRAKLELPVTCLSDWHFAGSIHAKFQMQTLFLSFLGIYVVRDGVPN